MKHAGAAALDLLEPLLGALRSIPSLRERTRGVFYLKGRPLLHFHEDPTGLFADLRSDEGWTRLPATSADAQARIYERIRDAADGAAQPRPPRTHDS